MLFGDIILYRWFGVLPVVVAVARYENQLWLVAESAYGIYARIDDRDRLSSPGLKSFMSSY